MRKSPFKKPLFVSVISHLALFGLFSFSLGPKITQPKYANVLFMGQVFINPNPVSRPGISGGILKPKESPQVKGLRQASYLGDNRVKEPVFLKPSSQVNLDSDKILPSFKVNLPLSIKEKKASSITFHPALPYDFLLYFKDRQVAHIELMFKISPNNKNVIDIKRKISSGNLEADLLSMRYISHYLFIRQFGVPADKWQAVKIELKTQTNNPKTYVHG